MLDRVRGGWRRIPRAGKACAAVAFLNAVVWALLIPPFHVPDEGVHVAYTQYLAETGKLPSNRIGPEYSSEQQALIDRLNFFATVGNRDDKPPWSQIQQRRLEAQTDGKARDDGGFKTVASTQPPLYYAIEADRLSRDAGREPPDPAVCHADRVGADGRADRDVRVPVPARAVPRHAVGVDRRGVGRRVPADVRLRVRRREQRQPAVPGERGAVLRARPCVPPRADHRARRGDRRGARGRARVEADDGRVRAGCWRRAPLVRLARPRRRGRSRACPAGRCARRRRRRRARRPLRGGERDGLGPPARAGRRRGRSRGRPEPGRPAGHPA